LPLELPRNVRYAGPLPPYLIAKDCREGKIPKKSSRSIKVRDNLQVIDILASQLSHKFCEILRALK
jgi:hypothetical protein